MCHAEGGRRFVKNQWSWYKAKLNELALKLLLQKDVTTNKKNSKINYVDRTFKYCTKFLINYLQFTGNGHFFLLLNELANSNVTIPNSLKTECQKLNHIVSLEIVYANFEKATHAAVRGSVSICENGRV